MVDAKRLLADLKRLRRTLDADLREHHAASPHRDAVHAEWQAALAAKRTADTFEPFWSAALDQAVVHWVLAIVFIRFLEDNRLLERPLLSGPGERLDLAAERQRAYVRQAPLDTDTDYLLAIFAEAATLPGLSGLYDPAHNPLFRLPLSGDGAMALLDFFRARAPETGELLHDFTDPAWNTRFLGDLYQDLSEDARKRYALLQTPDFVEEWILDRTLDPAMREFGGTSVRMIDPACGSGHFLLGGFFRVLAAWQREQPDMPAAAQAQQALDAVSGVDLNPFAVEIARFRLLLAALQAAEVTRLTAAPAFRFSLAVGDSLLHGRHFGQQRDFALEVDEGFRRTLRHHYAAEDTGELDAILGRQYHAVVGNPPYITPKDAALRDAYREIYVSCYMKYALAAPFVERFFDLASAEGADRPAGFVGLIVSNSFMKREFGAKLIEEVLPKLDLTHVVDCSGAYIPGHGTPTVILFGRKRSPVSQSVRMVMGIRGEPSTPTNPSHGLVWSAITAQVDRSGSSSEFISVSDFSRATLESHPWSIGGGGASELKSVLDKDTFPFGSLRPEIGFASFPGADDVFTARKGTFLRLGVQSHLIRPLVAGEQIRDYCIDRTDEALVPYDDTQRLISLADLGRSGQVLWNFRATLGGIVSFGGMTRAQLGEAWWGWYRWISERYRPAVAVTYAEIASHNHFVIQHRGQVLNRTAPIIKLPSAASQDDYTALVALLNSSVVCFLLKQVSHQKQMTGGDGVRVSSRAKVPYQFAGARIEDLPIPKNWASHPLKMELARLAQRAEIFSNTIESSNPRAAIEQALSSGTSISDVHDKMAYARMQARSNLICIQEDIDFLCYQIYGLTGSAKVFGTDLPEGLLIEAGERPFCILNQANQDGFAVPSEVPHTWPDSLSELWSHRIGLLRSSSALRLIEDDHYKRRWIGRQGLFNHKAGQDDLRDASEAWLLERLEDGRLWSADNPCIISTYELADLVRGDENFLAVSATYANREAPNVEDVVLHLVEQEAVPFLGALRLTDSGMRKWADWQATWDKQRHEDRIEAEVTQREQQLQQEVWADMDPRQEGESVGAYAARMQAALASPDYARRLQQAIQREVKRRKEEEIGTIPVPPKYKQVDFRSADFWRLRGGLDVPKERFVSFPHCARDADGSLPVLWAGADQLARAQAIAAWYVERKDTDGWPAPRLVPLLAGLLELLPWLRQWHNDIDPATGLRMGDYFADFIDEECRTLGLTLAELRDWRPPAPARRTRGRRAAN